MLYKVANQYSLRCTEELSAWIDNGNREWTGHKIFQDRHQFVLAHVIVDDNSG